MSEFHYEDLYSFLNKNTEIVKDTIGPAYQIIWKAKRDQIELEKTIFNLNNFKSEFGNSTISKMKYRIKYLSRESEKDELKNKYKQILKNK